MIDGQFNNHNINMVVVLSALILPQSESYWRATVKQHSSSLVLMGLSSITHNAKIFALQSLTTKLRTNYLFMDGGQCWETINYPFPPDPCKSAFIKEKPTYTKHPRLLWKWMIRRQTPPYSVIAVWLPSLSRLAWLEAVKMNDEGEWKTIWRKLPLAWSRRSRRRSIDWWPASKLMDSINY